MVVKGKDENFIGDGIGLSVAKKELFRFYEYDIFVCIYIISSYST